MSNPEFTTQCARWCQARVPASHWVGVRHKVMRIRRHPKGAGAYSEQEFKDSFEDEIEPLESDEARIYEGLFIVDLPTGMSAAAQRQDSVERMNPVVLRVEDVLRPPHDEKKPWTWAKDAATGAISTLTRLGTFANALPEEGLKTASGGDGSGYELA